MLCDVLFRLCWFVVAATAAVAIIGLYCFLDRFMLLTLCVYDKN